VNVKNILGILTASGDIHISSANGSSQVNAPNNLVIDAFLMASQYEFDVDWFQGRPAQGDIYILGGLTVGFEGVTGTDNAQGHLTNGYGLNMSYDRRAPLGTAIPPDFPLVNPQTQPFSIQLNNLTAKPQWQELL